MEPEARTGRRRFSGYEKTVAIVLIFLAVLSPLYIEKRRRKLVLVDAADSEEQPLNFAFLLPLYFLLVLTVAIVGSGYIDQSFTRFDPYWIHRVGGSSGGIFVIVAVLLLILRSNWFQ
ncbi:hypothetical protein Dimus_007126 [Dionaea muscipula]